VLSTLHTNDAPSTINRLMNMGIEPFLVASSLNLVCAQRLVRRVCVNCKIDDEVPPPALEQIGFTSDLAATVKPKKGSGCEKCNKTGYKGRVGLYEVMEITDELRELILVGASSARVAPKSLFDEGMITLARQRLRKITGRRARQSRSTCEKPVEVKGNLWRHFGSLEGNGGDAGLGPCICRSALRCRRDAVSTAELEMRMPLPELTADGDQGQLRTSVLDRRAEESASRKTKELGLLVWHSRPSRASAATFQTRRARLARFIARFPEKIRAVRGSRPAGRHGQARRAPARPRAGHRPDRLGKSTTLAAMIDKINVERHGHILTSKTRSNTAPAQELPVNQREIHSDTDSFSNALRAALREDPDVVLIGEMRDLETVESALRIAETGHLTFGTLHTNSASSTINRIIDVFPSHQQAQIRTQLSLVIEGIVCQALLPKADGKGRVVSLEISCRRRHPQPDSRRQGAPDLFGDADRAGKARHADDEPVAGDVVFPRLITLDTAMARRQIVKSCRK
jgi:hypothetical protein